MISIQAISQQTYIVQTTMKQQCPSNPHPHNISQLLHQHKPPKGTMLKYSKQDQKWLQVEIEEQINASTPYNGETITSLSFNVLFDRLTRLQNFGHREHVLNSKDRFDFILTQIQNTRPQLVGLQEVTKRFFQMVLECQWVRDRYWVSNFMMFDEGFGNLIMTTIPPICMFPIKINGLPRRAWTVLLPVGTEDIKIVAFISVHLIAYDKHSEVRRSQLKDLVSSLQKYQGIISDYVIQGDLNFHAESETQLALDLGLTDSWLQKHNNNLKDFPGYTFNSDTNMLINELYWGFETRNMRLDRMFYKGPIFQIQDIHIVFDKPISGNQGQVNKHMFLKGGLLFVADYFGWNVRDMREKLFASDHFGLLAQFRVKKSEMIVD